MTIKELKMIIEDLADDTVVLVQAPEVNEVESITIHIHSDGRSHLTFSSLI